LKNRLLAAVAALLFASPLAAEITIQIDRGYDNPKKIGVVPFGVGPGVQGVENPNAIIAFDLARSGQFSPTPPENMLSMPTAPKDVLFRDWRVLGVEYVVIGRTEVAADGNLAVSYYLFDVLNERQLANETFTAPPTALREPATEQRLGLPGVVVVGGIDEVDAEIECAIEDLETVGFVRQPREVRRAECDRADHQTGTAEFAVVHECSVTNVVRRRTCRILEQVNARCQTPAVAE